MLARLRKHTNSTRSDGQAMVEFALTLPILLFFILGLIDFGIILFSYAHASNSLRNALRDAEVLGYTSSGTTPSYRDCTKIRDKAEESWFKTDQTADIVFYNSANLSDHKNCSEMTDTLDNTWLKNGDLLHITLQAKVHPLFLPFGTLTLNFEGERSVIKTMPVVAVAGNPGEGSGGGGGGTGVAPATPTLNATTGCPSNKKVSFTWTWNGTKPQSAKIFRSDNTEVATITNTSNTSLANADPITDGTSQSYYMVSYNGTLASPKSNIAIANCNATPPAAPTSFTANAICNAGSSAQVSFTWDWGSGTTPTSAKIFNASDDSLIYVISDPTTKAATNIDSITIPGSRNYYIQYFNGATPGTPSSSSIAFCRANKPPAPQNLTATLNCATKKVSFTWTWPSVPEGMQPIPDRIEFYDSATSSQLTYVNTPMSTTCTDCALLPTGSASYYMVSYNGTGTLQSDPSLHSATSNTVDTSTCPVANGKITVNLQGVKNNKANCATPDAYAAGKPVTLLNVDTNVSTVKTTDASGTVVFDSLIPGNYRLTALPSSFKSGPTYLLTYYKDGATCGTMTTSTYPATGNFTLDTDENLSLIIGYKP